jgi:ammonia channel protein AmtB
VQPWGALTIGLISGIVYVAASRLVSHVLKIDDPLDAVAVHAFCGAWGLIAAALFAAEEPTEAAYSGMTEKGYGAAAPHSQSPHIPSSTLGHSLSMLCFELILQLCTAAASVLRAC